MTLPASFLDRLVAIVGASGVLTESQALEPYNAEERGLYHGACAAVVRPASTAEVAEVVRACAAAGVGVVPQGGNTGLCGAAVPAEGQIVLSLARLNKIREVDPVNFTMTVEAGVILQALHHAAEEVDCLFPLSLGAEGSCQIGGNLSTNAGGVNVLRYGNTRDLVLGIEAVLPDGQIWHGLRRLRKDNTGYDLKDLFIGAEGTLGIVTAAVVKLFPRPRDLQTAFVALAELDGVTQLLQRARAASGDQVTAFELIPRVGLDMVLRHVPGSVDPLQDVYQHYVLMELSSSNPAGTLRETLESILEAALDDGIVVDAALAESLDQRKALWRLRESLPEAQKHEGGSIKHDVAVPISTVPAFLRRATAAVEATLPGIRVVAFGHVGDGNIHFNLSQPVGHDKAAYLARWEEFNRVVHDIVVAMHGSISAEHGIGLLRKAEMARYKSPVELDMMKKIKAALDPQAIMNPGKVI